MLWSDVCHECVGNNNSFKQSHWIVCDIAQRHVFLPLSFVYQPNFDWSWRASTQGCWQLRMWKKKSQQPKMQWQKPKGMVISYYRKHGSASFIVREVRSVRERERERERKIQGERQSRKWRNHCCAKIGDEFTLPLPKIRTIDDKFTLSLALRIRSFVSPFTLPVSPFLNGHHCSPETRKEFTLSVAKTFRHLCSDSLKLLEPCDEWSKTQDKWSNPAQSYFVLSIKKNESN